MVDARCLSTLHKLSEVIQISHVMQYRLFTLVCCAMVGGQEAAAIESKTTLLHHVSKYWSKTASAVLNSRTEAI